eukprot:16439730-Heterocapsa_arctica.AAC.1
MYILPEHEVIIWWKQVDLVALGLRDLGALGARAVPLKALLAVEHALDEVAALAHEVVHGVLVAAQLRDALLRAGSFRMLDRER